jgi:hypothetical protein
MWFVFLVLSACTGDYIGVVRGREWHRSVQVQAWTPVVVHFDGQIEERPEEIKTDTRRSGLRLISCDAHGCEYETQAWKYVRTIHTSGTDTEPSYGHYEIDPNERVTKSERYSLEVEWNHQRQIVSVSAQTFRLYHQGDTLLVQENRTTGDVDLKPRETTWLESEKAFLDFLGRGNEP